MSFPFGDDYEPTETPGYWRSKTPCGGLAGGCREPLHTFLFNEGPTHHTRAFRDPRREDGRFASPYRTWRQARSQAQPAREETP